MAFNVHAPDRNKVCKDKADAHNIDFVVRHPRCVGSVTKNFSCIALTVEHNYISSSSTVGIQLHVSALYVGHLQVVI